MDKHPLCQQGAWYPGSPLKLCQLAPGSTITQWRELAEAFSHKPSRLEYDTIHGPIGHHGTTPGYLYIVNEPVAAGVDMHPHPRSTMDKGVEWLRDRSLKRKRIL